MGEQFYKSCITIRDFKCSFTVLSCHLYFTQLGHFPWLKLAKFRDIVYTLTAATEGIELRLHLFVVVPECWHDQNCCIHNEVLSGYEEVEIHIFSELLNFDFSRNVKQLIATSVKNCEYFRNFLRGAVLAVLMWILISLLNAVPLHCIWFRLWHVFLNKINIVQLRQFRTIEANLFLFAFIDRSVQAGNDSISHSPSGED